MKYKIITTLFISLNICSIYAQHQVSGKVVDQLENSLPFANIVLYQSGDDKVITGTISNDDGDYLFQNIPDGNYWVEVSVLGFKTERSDTFALSGDNDDKEVNFILREEAQVLNEVVVQSKRPVIRQTAEKLVVDMESSEIVSSNLQDVMKRVPGIIVTNGNLSYAGQQGVRILINGKTTDYMDTASLLRDLPADNIAKVELIQQPGAEFDAEGSGPVINIILKKNVRLGTNGNIKANVGYDNTWEYGTGFTFANYRNKLNWQVSAGYRKTAWREDLFITRRVNDQIYDQASISPFDPNTLNLSGAADYYINDHHTIGVNIRRIQTDSDRTSSNNTTIIEDSSSEPLFTENSFDRNRITFTVNPYYEFKDEKNKIVLDFNYVDYNNDNTNNLYKTEQSSVEYNNQRYLQDGKYKILTYKGDYKRTVSENFNWMLGVKYSVVDTDSDLQSFVQNTNGEFIFDGDQSDRFLVGENILALYSKWSAKLDEWTFSGGVRWEESDTKGKSTSTGETRARKISKFFPSAAISRSLTKNIGASLSYSYRISRPSYNSLNSFVYYYDPYTFEQGNPNLKPAFTNSFQFNLTYDEQPFFSVGYTDTSDALFEIITQNDATAQTSRSVINLAERENWNFKVFAPLSFLEGLDGYSGFIVNHGKYKSSGLSPEVDLSKWSLTWYTNLQYMLPWNINSELTGFYSTGGLQGLIEYKWLAGLSFAVSKKFMNDKLKVNLGIGEILNRQFIGTIQYDNINADVVSDWSRQNVYFQLTYNFGSNFNKTKNRDNSSKDEQERIEDNN